MGLFVYENKMMMRNAHLTPTSYITLYKVIGIYLYGLKLITKF